MRLSVNDSLERLIAAVCFSISILMSTSAFGGWFSKKPNEKDVSSAILTGRGDDPYFITRQHNIDPSSVKVAKSSVDGVWKVSYEAKDPITGKSARYISDVTTYERKKGKGIGLHFINTETKEPPKSDISPLSSCYDKYYKAPKEWNYGKGDVLKTEIATTNFCGFKFGHDYLYWGKDPYDGNSYLKAREGKMPKPFRYLSKAWLYLQNVYFEGKTYPMLFHIILSGLVPNEMTTKEQHSELAAMAKIISEKYGIELENSSPNHYGDKCECSWRFGRQVSKCVWNEEDFLIIISMGSDNKSFCLHIINHYPIRMLKEAKKPRIPKRDFSANDGADVL